MNSVAGELSTARIKITRKNCTRVDAVLEAGDCTIDGIDGKIIQKNFNFS